MTEIILTSVGAGLVAYVIAGVWLVSAGAGFGDGTNKVAPALMAAVGAGLLMYGFLTLGI